MTNDIPQNENPENRTSLTEKPKRKNSAKTRAKPEKAQSQNGQTWDHENEPSSKKKVSALELCRQTALEKLGIDPAELAKVPPIAYILEQAEGGIPAVISAMRFSNDENVEKFLEEYDKEPDRHLLPFEAFCLLADVDASDLLGAAILALMQQNANIVKIIAVTSHPATMRARVRNALKPGGYRDRNAIDTALRFLPQPKGSTTLIQIPGGGVVVQDALNPDDVDTQDLFPALADTQKMLTEG